MNDEGFALLLTAAKDAADDAGQHPDYRGQYIHIGRGLIYAVSALAVSVGRFATAIAPKENPE